MKILKKLTYLLPLLFVIFTTSAFATKEMKIVFVGNYASGKSALRAKLCDMPFNFTSRKVTKTTTKYSKNLRYKDKDIMCHLYDTSGEEKVKNSIILDRLKDANIAVITIDVSRNAIVGYQDVIEQSLDEWIRTIRRNQPKCYIIVAFTKADESRMDAKTMGKKRKSLGILYERLTAIITSAVNGTGINEFWMNVVEIIEKERMYDSLKDWNNFEELKGDSDDAQKSTFCVIS